MSTIDEQIKELQDALTELQAKVNAKEVKPMFELPKKGDDYFAVNGIFNINNYIYGEDSEDEKLMAVNNAFTSEAQAKACADHLARNFWFIRKAIEFADGYEVVAGDGAANYCVEFNHAGEAWELDYDMNFQRDSIYMTKESANEFCEWLNEHKPNGWR